MTYYLSSLRHCAVFVHCIILCSVNLMTSCLLLRKCVKKRVAWQLRRDRRWYVIVNGSLGNRVRRCDVTDLVAIWQQLLKTFVAHIICAMSWRSSVYHFFFYSFFPPTGHGCTFTGGLLFLLQATAAREPIPAPGGRKRGRQTEGREASGIEPETSRSEGWRLTTCVTRGAKLPK